jgi:hypothetical protein
MDGIHLHQIVTKEGNTLEFSYDPENGLVAMNLISKGRGERNELLRIILNEKAMLKHCEENPESRIHSVSPEAGIWPDVPQYEAIRHLTHLYDMLVGKPIRVLTEEELRVVYAYKMWEDGMAVEDVMREMTYDDESQKMPINAIRTVLRDVFGIKAETIVY